jgi:hypothetical protein
MPRRIVVKQLPLPPSVVFVDIDGLRNHLSEEQESQVMNSSYGGFDMYGLDEIEYREIQRGLKEKNLARQNHMKHVLNRR